MCVLLNVPKKKYMRKHDKKYIENLIFGYFLHELTEEKEKELLIWLNDDPSHELLLSKMADWWGIAHTPRFNSNMRSNFETYFGHLLDQDKDIKKISGINWSRWRNIAAIGLLIVSVGSISFYAGRISVLSNTEDILTEQQIFSEVVTPLGSTSKIVLPDGSVVWVNAGSTLTYNYDYNKATREVNLLGEAYFEVTHDPLRPFIVKSEELDIKVVGTSFNVKAYQNEESVNVSLVTGTINVHINNGAVESEEVTLSPDRMLSFNKDSNSVEIIPIEGKDAMAWTSGRVKFTEQPFVKIVKDLERKFSVSIRIESERLKKETYSGSFSPNHTLDQILREVDVDKKYRWTKHRDEIIIRDK